MQLSPAMARGASLERQFLTEIRAFLARSGLTESEFGQAAIGDKALVLRLERGASPTLRTVGRVRAFMKSRGRPPSRNKSVALAPDGSNGRRAT